MPSPKPKRDSRGAPPAAPRRTREEVEASVKKAAMSDMLWTAPVLDVMAHFRLRHTEVKEARALALQLRPKEVGKLMESQQKATRMKSALTVEQLHPGVHRRIVETREVGEEIGERYDITRARISQIKRNLEGVAKDLSVTAAEAARRVEAAATKLRG